MFEDDDGTVYAFWNGQKKMYAAEVDVEKMQPVGNKPIEIFYPTAGTWDGIGIEGPYCIKHKDTYYLFYSSWSRGYEIGYATAKHPLGPWTKYEGNPIYGAQSKGVCKKNNLPYTGDPNCPFRAVGHNEVFTGPDGRLWLSCHGILEGGIPDAGHRSYVVRRERCDPLNGAYLDSTDGRVLRLAHNSKSNTPGAVAMLVGFEDFSQGVYILNLDVHIQITLEELV